MRRAGAVVGEVLDLIEAELAPGVSTAHLDALAEAHIREAGAIPSFKGYPGHQPATGRSRPASASRSTTRSSTASRASGRSGEGQIVSVDAGAILDGWHGDGARTFYVGDPPPAVAELIDRTRRGDDGRHRGRRARATTSRTSRSRSRPSPARAGLGRHPPVRRPRHRHRDARGAAGPELPDRPAGAQARARPLPRHRADVHARRPRHADPRPTTGRS